MRCLIVAILISINFISVDVMALENSNSSNRLIHEKSPYLLQHAHNPVDWFPWGREAFDKAKKEDKPVFLSIGYSTCHWCHVMEDESFSNPETAKLLNDNYIAIKVDREERPDLDNIYMSYVTAATGSGGWPMSVFLTPDQKPFYGGTYFPPQDRWGIPGFPTLLNSIHESWKTQRGEIQESADSAVKFLSERAANRVAATNLGAKTIEQAFHELDSGFDETYGGFGRAPKFPRTDALSVLLRYWFNSKNQKALEIVEKTLDAMAAGGIYDQLGGGFHRYSTDARWRIPHFEKMLYDQALLTGIYLEAYQATGKKEYARVVRETLDYVLSRMTSSEGGFYSAEDADSLDPSNPGKKREGAYYVWTNKEIEDALGADKAKKFCAYFGVEENGNALTDPHGEFKEQNVLYLSSLADSADPVIGEGKKKLLAIRSKRPAPHLDDKILADWNGLMISAFARAAVILKEKKYAQAAQNAASFIDQKMKRRNGGLFRRFRQNEAAIAANLNDYAFLIQGYLHVYEATLDLSWIQKARVLADEMLDLFWDADGEGFFLTARDAEVLISRPKEVYDGALPSGNSAAAMALVLLGRYTGEESYENAAMRTIDAFSEMVAKSPSNYPAMLGALGFVLGPSREVVVVSNGNQADSEVFLNLVWKDYYPNQAVLLSVPAEKQLLAGISPFAAEKGALQGKTTAYICRNRACDFPVSDLKALESKLHESEK